MAEQKRFLRQTYGAYHQNQVPNEDEELTHVGPGTPGGEYLRRFWHPIAHAPDLKDLPLAVRVLGEDLVLFRDKSGQFGLLERHCSHRGTSLEYGKIEEHGIRCCYHSWLFDVDGRILETPNEPADSTLKDRLCHGAYPLHVYGDMIFTYMGPPDTTPPFPVLDSFELPGYELGFGELIGVPNIKPCNWVQIMDNVLDIAHEAFLHATISGYQFFSDDGKPVTALAKIGECEFVETEHGVLCQETRRVDEEIWVRTLEFICPNIAQIAQSPSFPTKYKDGETENTYLPRITRWRVPVDDTSTMEYAFVRLRPGQENTYITRPNIALRANYGERSYDEMQRTPGDYEAQVGQRAIARHATEHLTATDRGVAIFRRMVREGIEAVREGKEPKGLSRAGNGVIPTYGNDAVLRVPPAPTPEQDLELLHETARKLTERILEDPPAQRADVTLA